MAEVGVSQAAMAFSIESLDVTALVDRFVAIGDSQAKMHFDERDFIANMLLCVHPSNFSGR